MDRSVNQLQRAIISSYYHNCPSKTTRSPRTTPWWNKELNGFAVKIRKLFTCNIAERTRQWDNYKDTIKKSEIQRSLMEGLLPGEQRCTGQCQTHENHGKTGDQQSQHC
jgi:hypothetical protein